MSQLTYKKLFDKLSADVIDFIENGFRIKVVKVIKDDIMPELKGQIIDMYEQSTNAQRAFCTHYQEGIDRRINKMQEVFDVRLQTAEHTGTIVNEMRRRISQLEQNHDKDSQILIRIDERTANINNEIGVIKIYVQKNTDRINKLEDAPGKNALRAWDKLKWVFIGASPGVVGLIYGIIQIVKVFR